MDGVTVKTVVEHSVAPVAFSLSAYFNLHEATEILAFITALFGVGFTFLKIINEVYLWRRNRERRKK